MNYQPDHIERAKVIQAAVRNRPPGRTAQQIMAEQLAKFEAEIIERCAALADVVAQAERLKGAGTIALNDKGGPAAPGQHQVDLYVWRFNLAEDLATVMRHLALGRRNGTTAPVPNVRTP
jgi:hypothetical protein